MKRFAVLLGVMLIPAAAWSQLPVYYGALYGLIADDSTDNCSAMNAVMTTAANAGGGIIQLPIGKFTKLFNCNLTIPNNVIIRGSGNQGWNQGTGVVPSSGLHMTYNNPGDYHIKCLGTSGPPAQGGLCGLEDLEVLDDTTNTPFMLYTCGVPYLRNVMFKGEKSANGTPKCASGGMAVCPDNDGVFFGAGGSSSSACNDPTAGFNGYGANVIDGVYFQNIRTAVTLHDNANGLNFKRLWGDYTDAYPMNYFVYIDASVTSAYGNTFEDVNIEQAPNGSMLCNYAGAFGLNHNAQQNQISYVTSDVGNCTHGAYVLTSSSYWNDITNIGAYYNGNPAVSDFNQSYSNGVYDMPNKTLYRQTYVGFGIDTPSSVTGIPNARAFGGIVGFSGTGAAAFNGGNYQLFSDGAISSTQFTVFPLEGWLAQFTLNTSTSNGTAPIQMQPVYSLGGSTPTAQPSPIVFSIPDGAIAQSYPTNAPPFYVSAENLISFQGNIPITGPTYATVRGFSASIMGRPGGGLPTAASTVLGTYYNHTVAANQTYWTSFSQQMGWANNTNENLAYTVVPFTYAAQVLCVYTSTSQGGGSLTITLRQNGSNAGPVVTIPTGSAAGTWCDGSHSFTSSNVGDKLDLQLVNTYGSPSANIVSITLSMTPTSPATGMLVFGLGGKTLANNNYFAPFGGGNGTTTSTFAQVALPRAVTIKNLHCYVTSCPGASVTFTVYQNTTAGPTVTISSPCTINHDYTDLVNTLTFAAGDKIELFESQGIGGAGSISSCTVEHD